MPKLSKTRGKEPESSRAHELPANDQLDQENTNLNQIPQFPQFPQIPPMPNLEDLTPAEREFQQRMLFMEGILRDVIHENTRL